MRNFLTGLMTFMQTSGTGFQSFLGSYLFGNSTQYGPFIDVAPKQVDAPYMTYKVVDNQPMFGYSKSYMTDEIYIRFILWDYDAENLATNADILVHKFDNTSSITLPNGETCNSILRKTGIIPLADKFDEQNRRVYSMAVTYLFRNTHAV